MVTDLNQLIETDKAYQTALDSCQRNGSQLFRELRKRFGWSQRKLAKLLRCDHTYISKIENNRLKPGKPILMKLGKLIENGK